MAKLFKCTVCNYIYEAEEPLDKCHICGAGKDKMEELSEEATAKIYNANRSNTIHMDIMSLAGSIADLCEEGIEDNLDPTCVTIFKRSKELAWQMKQMSKAEVSNHIGKGKW